MMSRNFIVEDLELTYGQLDWSEYSNTDLRRLAFRLWNGSTLTNGSEVRLVTGSGTGLRKRRREPTGRADDGELTTNLPGT
jgi:hypothetical protein